MGLELAQVPCIAFAKLWNEGRAVANRGVLGPRAAALEIALRTSTVLAVVLVLVGMVLGGVVGLRESNVETARATILVNPLDGNPFSTSGSGDDLVNMVTESELVGSDAVSAKVKALLATPESSRALLQGLSVDVPPNSQIIEIGYETREKGQSVPRAQAFAEQFLAYRQDRTKSLVASQSQQIQQQVEARTKEQADLAAKVAKAADGSAASSALQAQLDSVSTQINQLRARAADTELVPVNPGQVVTPAAVRPKGIIGSWVAFPLAGMLAGLLAALATALIRARLDNRVHHPDDIAIMGHTLLGEVSHAESKHIETTLATSPASATPTDSYRNLRVSLLTAEQRRPLVLLLATASSHASPPATAAPLMLAMAASRLDTVLVDTLGSVTRAAGSSNTPATGLSDILAADGDPAPALHEILPHGKVIRNGDPLSIDDLFMTPQMDSLMSLLRDQSDVVIVVAGSIHDSRTLALANACDVVVLEATTDDSTFADLRRTTDDMEAIGDKLLGVILVNRPSDHVRGSGRSHRRRRGETNRHNEEANSEINSTAATGDQPGRSLANADADVDE